MSTESVETIQKIIICNTCGMLASMENCAIWALLISYLSFRCDIPVVFYKLNTEYEGWNFNSGNYLFTTDTK